MATINDINIVRLTNAGHYAFITNVKSIIANNEKIAANFEKLVKNLTDAFEAEDETYKLATKSEYTSMIEEVDSERDVYYMGFKKIVEAYDSMAIDDTKTAAFELNELIKLYRINTRQERRQQTSQLTNLIQQLQSDKYKDHVAALNLTTVVNCMSEANVDVETYMLNRSEEQKSFVAGAHKKSRVASDEAYKKLVARLNVEADDSTDYDSAIESINQQIKEFKNNVITKSTSSSSNSDVAENTTSAAEQTAEDTETAE